MNCMCVKFRKFVYNFIYFILFIYFFFFFKEEEGIRDIGVNGVKKCDIKI